MFHDTNGILNTWFTTTLTNCLEVHEETNFNLLLASRLASILSFFFLVRHPKSSLSLPCQPQRGHAKAIM
jgi:hypothetical protein